MAVKHAKRTETAVLIDIGAASVAGACVKFVEGEAATLLYTRRLPIELRKDEPQEQAMLRALEILGKALVTDGSPVLSHETGSQRPNSIFVSIDAPWQKTSMHTERIEKPQPFLFTKNMVKEILQKQAPAQRDAVLSDESIIGTVLNGYETHEPYGRKPRRVTMYILTSYIDRKVADGVTKLLQGFYKTKHIPLISGSSLRYQAARIAFPFERNAIILDATGPLAAVALVRNNLLVALSETAGSEMGSDGWVEEIRGALGTFSQHYPLPRMIFAIARETDIPLLNDRLNSSNIGSLWLSDIPPKIVSFRSSHVVDSVRQASESSADISLTLMALFWQHRKAFLD